MSSSPSPPPRRVVLITGATGGIGRATALAFAKKGIYDLALHYNTASQTTRDAITAAIQACIPEPSKDMTQILWFQADMSSYAGVRTLHEDVTDIFHKVDILFNNAGSTGGASGNTKLWDIPIDTFEKTWRINTASGILLSQLCVQEMVAQKYGRVIFNSSVAALIGGFVGPHYASSKSALHGFVHWLGNDVGKDGVTVNAVAPALVKETAMFDPDEEREREMAARMPVGRLGLPEEVAGTVMWMVETGYVTRKIIAVDGGVHPC